VDKKTYTEFWKGASTFYPILARMARDYGTILSTSVPSESVFSIARLQITKRRNRLAPKTMGVIMCLRSWGLISEEGDDDEESDDEDIRKDRALGRVEPGEAVIGSLPQ
jgi:hAT family C-terminal dimerisation region